MGLVLLCSEGSWSHLLQCHLTRRLEELGKEKRLCQNCSSKTRRQNSRNLIIMNFSWEKNEKLKICFCPLWKIFLQKLNFSRQKNRVIYHDVFVGHIWPIFTTELIQNLLARCSFKSAFANQQFGKIQHHVSLFLLPMQNPIPLIFHGFMLTFSLLFGQWTFTKWLHCTVVKICWKIRKYEIRN